jgi:hypothetical protein
MKKHLYYLTAFFFSTTYFTLPAQTDQELIYGSYFAGDGSGFDAVGGIAEFADGSFAICGRTESKSGLSTPGAHQPDGTFALDGFVAMFNSEREILWSTYFGGGVLTNIRGGIHSLSDGSLVFAGQSASQSGIATPGAFQTTIAPNTFAGFIARFSAEGFPIWSTYLSGSSMFNRVLDMAIFENDDILVVGSTDSPDFPITPGAIQNEFGGNYDGFISRFNSAGELLWSTYYGGLDYDHIHAVTIDDDENIIALGRTESSDQIATVGAHQESYGGGSDLFLVKISNEGNVVWSTYFGGPEIESNFSKKLIHADSGGNIYFTGTTESETSIATPGAYQSALAGNESVKKNVLLAKFSPEGEQIWGTYFGSHSSLTVEAMTIRSGDIILTGQVFEDDEVIFGNSWLDEIPSTTLDGSVYITAFNSDGFPIWGTYYGGPSDDKPEHILGFSDNTLAVTGYSHSAFGITTTDGFQTEHLPYSGFFSFFDINFSTGISETEFVSLSLFPNPTHGAVRMQLPPHFAFQADVVVYNSVGQVVSQHAAFNALQVLPLNHPPGLYIVEARNGRQVARGKVVLN